MKNKLITVNEEIYLDSRQVAEMVGKRHADLLRDIDKFVDVLENAKMRSLDFFAKSVRDCLSKEDLEKLREAEHIVEVLLQLGRTREEVKQELNRKYNKMIA